MLRWPDSWARRHWAGHGKEWAAIFLALVRHQMGTVAAERLRQSFVGAPVGASVAHKVRHRWSLPQPTKTVVTKTQVAAKQKALAARPVDAANLRVAARTIRRLATQGQFGPAGRKPRIHALETARHLERLANEGTG